MKFTALGFLLIIFSLGCNETDSAGQSSLIINSNGLIISNANDALGSIGTMSSKSKLQIDHTDSSNFCNDNGEPKVFGGADLTTSNDAFASASGYCLTVHNSYSPDTIRGAMYIAGGVTCEIAKNGLFDDIPVDGSKSDTITIEISTDCFGTPTEVANLIADAGQSSFPGVTASVEDVSSSTAYQYKISYVAPFGTSSLYISNENGVIAALMTADAWAFKMDTNSGVILFEGIDDDNDRWNRLRVEGNISAAGDEFTSVTSIEGFQSTTNGLISYSGDLGGIIGDFYPGSGTGNNTSNCHIPYGPSDCTGFSTPINTSDTAQNNLQGALSSSNTKLGNYINGIINFSSVNAGDTDITPAVQ